MHREAWQVTVHGVTESDTTDHVQHAHTHTHTHTHTTGALSRVQHLIIHLPMSQHLSFLRNLQSVEPLSTIKIYMFQQTKQK